MTPKKKPVEEPEVRAYPQCLEAERGVLGAVVQRPEILDEVALHPNDFYRHEHRRLWALLLEMKEHREAIDLITVPDRVARLGKAAVATYGGVAYVMELPEHAPATVNVGYWASLVKEAARLRRVLVACEAATAAAYARDTSDKVIDELIAALVEAAE